MASGLPPGWTALSGVVEPAERVADYAARGQVVKGNCRAHGCNRHVTIEPKAMCGAGLGTLPMHKIQTTWRCQRLDGCELNFFKEKPDYPLRLEHVAGLPNIRVKVACGGNGCKYSRVFLVEEVIAGLVKRRQGDGGMEIDKLAPLMKNPCPLCKKANWGVSLLWSSPDSAGWRALGPKVFDGK